MSDPAASLQRYDGAANFALGPSGVTALRQVPPMRLFRPHREAGEPETVVIGNIAGGVAGGDRLATSIRAEDADLLALTQAAEKVYRTPGPAASMALDLTATGSAALEWLSSGTILFDGSDLARETRLSVMGAARLLFVEIVLFGRSARQERFAGGRLRDRIRLSVDDRLVWMDDLALGPEPLAQIDHPAGLGGAVAVGTVLLRAPDATVQRDAVRNLKDLQGVRHGAVALAEDLLLYRAFGPDAYAVRRSVEAVCRALRSSALGRPARMPTLWSV